jgi:hypothetical protein
MKKPRGDAKLKNLAPEKRKALYELLQQHTLDEVVVLLRSDGIHTGTRALSEFYSWYPLSQHLEQASTFASSLRTQLAQDPRLKDKAAELAEFAQIAFEARAIQSQNSEEFLALKKTRLKEREVTLNESKHEKALREEKAKNDAAKSALEKAKSKGGLSAETLALIEEQLKLL